MDALIDFIQTWGYVAVLLGAMVEGESIILTASFLAAQGYLSISYVMLVAFLGTLFADQGLFFVGHRYGAGFLERFPSLNKAAGRAFGLLQKWGTLYILLFRFIYGVRIISPLVIGASGIAVRRFVILNFIAAIIWTVISCMLGYMLGEVVHHVITNFKVYQFYFLGIVVFIVACFALYYRYRQKKIQSQDGIITHNKP
ncbi:MAG: DedA family protein [Alphaproteobacteria bacterium]